MFVYSGAQQHGAESQRADYACGDWYGGEQSGYGAERSADGEPESESSADGEPDAGSDSIAKSDPKSGGEPESFTSAESNADSDAS